MGNTSKNFVLILAALFLTSFVALPSTVLADSEFTSGTFPLHPSWHIQYYLDLQKNDRFEGNFTVSDLLPYKPVMTLPWANNEIHTYSISVTMIMSNPEPNKPGPYNPQRILDFNKVNGNSLYSFNWTANNSAHYLVIFYCSEESFPSDAKIPQMTFEYNVVEATPTEITVLSPLNQTYTESNLYLNFTTKKPLSWVGYSLDGKSNVTIDNNTTLTGLSNGLHKITVYANNTYGNVVVPETVFFTVEPFPIMYVAVSVVVVVAVFGVCLLVYFKKRNSGQNQ